MGDRQGAADAAQDVCSIVNSLFKRSVNVNLLQFLASLKDVSRAIRSASMPNICRVCSARYSSPCHVRHDWRRCLDLLGAG
jgi:hypothetical protein